MATHYDYDPLFDEPPEDDLPPIDYYTSDAEHAAATPQHDQLDASDPKSEAAYQAREAERARERESLFARLNPRQLEAVNMPLESVLVLAGAGSGKTSVLTARIAELVSKGRVGSRSVLAVTFTNKSAQEMRNRLGKLLDRRTVQDMLVGTFHGISNKILRDNYEAAGLPKSFAILDTDGQEAVARGILKDFGLTKASLKEAAKARAAAASKQDLLSAVDPLAAAGGIAAEDLEDDGEANEFVTPVQCAKYISSRKEGQNAPNPPAGGVTTRSTDVEQMEAVYAEYEARLRKSGLVDFQDLLTRTVEMLKAHPDIRDEYRQRFTAQLVDEYQDTNDLQYELLELLRGPSAHVMAVGDDSQSIYAFRGANPENMMKFVAEVTKTRDFPDGRIIKLEQNYRSLPHILDAANAIIDRNPGQIKKTLFTSQPDRGERIDLVTFGSGAFEASAIGESIHRLVRDQKVAPSEIAILYRTNTQSRALEGELNKRGVPLTVYGGYRFYDRQEIKNLLAYLDLIGDITRDLSVARVVNFPPRGIGERTVEELRQDAQHKRLSMLEVVAERSEALAQNPHALGNAAAQRKQRQLEGFLALVLDLAESAATQPLSQLIETVVEKAGIKKHYEDEATGSKSSQDEAEERMANIGELISATRQFELDNPTLTTAAEQLPEYLAYVTLMTSTSEADMNKKQTVSLMSIHSSKGLEFDHVYLTGLEENTFPHARAIKEDEGAGNGKSIDQALRDMGLTQDEEGNDLGHDDPDAAPTDGPGLQEERRLMYVAVTRARKSLTITHAKERMLNGEVKPCEPSRFLQEIPLRRLNLIDDAQQNRAGSGKKPFLREVKGAGVKSGAKYAVKPVDNREYGGDAFDEGRAEYKPTGKAAARPELQSQTSFAESDLSTDARITGAGSCRVVSKRRGGTQEAEGETVIDCDRSHPTLGNRHYLADINDDAERAQVCDDALKDLVDDEAANGPKSRTIADYARRVADGERLALRCWCAPKQCHLDPIVERIVAQALSLKLTAGSTSHESSPAAPSSEQPKVAASATAARDTTGGLLDMFDAVEQSASTSPVNDPLPTPAAKLKPWQQVGVVRRALNAPTPAPARAPAATAHLSVVPTAASRAPGGDSVAIIGSAGRNAKMPLTRDLWDRAVADVSGRVSPGDGAVSGGAAWFDHLAVRLFLDGRVRSLTLHLPAPLANGRFVGPRDSAGSAANFYHDNFTKATGVDGRKEIAEAIAKGAIVTEQPAAPGFGGFFGRNALVAKSVTRALAYTFGSGAEPDDGGTKNTWGQLKCEKLHIPVLSLAPVKAAPLAASSSDPAPAPAPARAPATAANLPAPKTMERLNLLGKRRSGSRP